MKKSELQGESKHKTGFIFADIGAEKTAPSAPHILIYFKSEHEFRSFISCFWCGSWLREDVVMAQQISHTHHYTFPVVLVFSWLREKTLYFYEIRDLQLWQQDALLVLIFAFAVGIRDFANLVALEEEHLGDAFIGVDFGGQRSGVGDFEGDKAFPFRLERGDVDDDAAARIGALAHADGEGVAGDAEIFDRPCQGKGIGRDDAGVAFEIDHGFRIEVLGINGDREHIGEDLELIGHANIVTVRGKTVRNDACAYLVFNERLDHALLLRHSADPFI